MAEARLLAVPDLGTHLSLLSSDFSTTLTGFLDAHQTCAPVIGVSLSIAPRHKSTGGGENNNSATFDQGSWRDA